MDGMNISYLTHIPIHDLLNTVIVLMTGKDAHGTTNRGWEVGFSHDRLRSLGPLSRSALCRHARASRPWDLLHCGGPDPCRGSARGRSRRAHEGDLCSCDDLGSGGDPGSPS